MWGAGQRMGCRAALPGELLVAPRLRARVVKVRPAALQLRARVVKARPVAPPLRARVAKARPAVRWDGLNRQADPTGLTVEPRAGIWRGKIG